MAYVKLSLFTYLQDLSSTGAMAGAAPSPFAHADQQRGAGSPHQRPTAAQADEGMCVPEPQRSRSPPRQSAYLAHRSVPDKQVQFWEHWCALRQASNRSDPSKQALHCQHWCASRQASHLSDPGSRCCTVSIACCEQARQRSHPGRRLLRSPHWCPSEA